MNCHKRILSRRGFLAGAAAAGASLASASLGLAAESDPIVRPQARAQTVPVPHGGDAADDPAIWLHPTNPARSLIIATDKQGALHVYAMDGREQQIISDGCRPNNVDVLYGFSLGGREVDLAVASTRASRSTGAKVWRIDPATGALADATAGGTLPVFGGHVPYGICTYHSAKTGNAYFFVNNKAGQIEQHELQDTGTGTVSSAKVREMKLSSITEGCVADDEFGHLYVAEENVGIWKFPAEPGFQVRDRRACLRIYSRAVSAEDASAAFRAGRP